MKGLILLLPMLILSLATYSQSEIVGLYPGEIIDIDEVSVEFVELISDSRCPVSVNCIRAGEAEVLVAVYKNGKFSHEKVLTFHANGLVEQSNMKLFASDGLFVRGLTLEPYPKGLKKIQQEEYLLSLAID